MGWLQHGTGGRGAVFEGQKQVILSQRIASRSTDAYLNFKV